MNTKIIWSAVVVVAIISIIGIFTPRVGIKLGAATPSTNLNSLGLGYLAVGSGCSDSNSSCTGSQINQINVGTCYIQPYATTIAASTTALVDCQATAAVGSTTIGTTNDTALTGVQNNDAVQATLSTTTAGSTYFGLHLLAASASTTNGYIALRLLNLTGTTFTWPTTGSASGTASYLTTR